MATQKTLTFQPTGDDLAISAIQNWCITVSDDATASEQYAAEEFQNWFNQATRLTLRRVNTNADNGQIAIGALATLGAEDIQITVESGQRSDTGWSTARCALCRVSVP